MKDVWKILALAGTLGACAASPAALLDEARGATSQILCTKVFVTGVDPDVAFAEHMRPEPGMGLIAWSVRYEVDREKKEVRTRIGGDERRAVFREGRGVRAHVPRRP